MHPAIQRSRACQKNKYQMWTAKCVYCHFKFTHNVAKSNYQLYHVCMSVCMADLSFYWTGICDFWCWSLLLKSLGKSRLVKIRQKYWATKWSPKYIYNSNSLDSSWVENNLSYKLYTISRCTFHTKHIFTFRISWHLRNQYQKKKKNMAQKNTVLSKELFDLHARYLKQRYRE